MKNRYKIYPELNFGVAKVNPELKSFEELYQLAEIIREDPDFSKIYYQFTDLRGCSFDFEISRLSNLVSLIEENQKRDNQKVGVYIIDKPVGTAYVQIFFNSLKYKREFCSTLEKAYCLLGIQISFKEFKKLIEI